MNKIRLVPALLLVLALAAVTASTSVAASQLLPKTIAFTANYAGHVTEKVNDQTVTAVTTGSGSGTLIKKSTISGTVVASTAGSIDTGCAPFNGPGLIKSAIGTMKLSVLPTSRGCAASQEEQSNITISGTVKVLSGTLKLKKAHGTLHFSGHYDRSSGAFTVKISGKLTY